MAQAAGAGQAQDPQRRHPLPGAARAPAARAHRRRAGRALPAVQRGLRRHRGRRPRARTTCAPRRSAWPALLAALMPDEPEALGLLALMLLHDARRAARVDARRRARDRSRTRTARRWDRDRDRRGRRRCSTRRCAGGRAGPVPGAGGDRGLPRERRRRARDTDWARDRRALRAARRSWCPRRSSSSTARSRSAMADGPAAGLALVDGAGSVRRAGRLPPAAGDARRPAAPPRATRRGGRRLPRGARAGAHRRRAPLPDPTAGRGHRRG